uniref:Transposase n=1 Tax=Macrostomum lignano TaxID=282301 RepID=A0A1I8F5M2_9PLAT
MPNGQGDRLDPSGTAYLSRLGVHFYAPAAAAFALVVACSDATRPVCQFLVCSRLRRRRRRRSRLAAAARSANWQRLVESQRQARPKTRLASRTKRTTAAELYVPVDTVKRTQFERVELLRVPWRPRGVGTTATWRRDGRAEADLICTRAVEHDTDVHRHFVGLLSELDDLGLTSISDYVDVKDVGCGQAGIAERRQQLDRLCGVTIGARGSRGNRLGATRVASQGSSDGTASRAGRGSTVPCAGCAAAGRDTNTKRLGRVGGQNGKRCQPLLRTILHDMGRAGRDPRRSAHRCQKQADPRRHRRSKRLNSAGVKTVATIERATPPDRFKPASVRQQARILGVTPAEDAKYNSDSETGSISGASVGQFQNYGPNWQDEVQQCQIIELYTMSLRGPRNCV